MPPAARIGDVTDHGGVIMETGVPNVRIGGMIAAVLGDYQKCPQFDGPKPHEGGLILPPCSATVRIGGRPAARVGDITQCIGSQGVIASGAPTVLIGG